MRTKKINFFLIMSFFIVALYAEELGDDEVIKNLEFLQLMEMMESEMTLEEFEELDSIQSTELLGDL